MSAIVDRLIRGGISWPAINELPTRLCLPGRLTPQHRKTVISWVQPTRIRPQRMLPPHPLRLLFRTWLWIMIFSNKPSILLEAMILVFITMLSANSPIISWLQAKASTTVSWELPVLLPCHPFRSRDTNIDHFVSHFLCQIANPPIGQNYSGFEHPFQELHNFSDGPGLPPEWSPYYHDPNLEQDLVDPALRGSMIDVSSPLSNENFPSHTYNPWVSSAAQKWGN